MRLSFKLAASLVVSLSLLAFVFAWVQVDSEHRIMRRDLERRSAMVADTLRQTYEQGVTGVERLAIHDPLTGVAVFDAQGTLVASTPGLKLPQALRPVTQVLKGHSGLGEFLTIADSPRHVYAVPLHRGSAFSGVLAVVSDSADISLRLARIRRDFLLRAALEALLLTLITLFIVRWNVTIPVASTVKWMRDLRMGRNPARPASLEPEVFQSLEKEMGHFARSLKEARATAEEEARLRLAGESLWTAERLRLHIMKRLGDSKLFVLSNREPYSHVRRGKQVEVVVPPSGLVTAIEPILCACDGVWIAHGSGDADVETVGRRDSLRVPPEYPQYTLRRVWLTKEEEQGYYNGFANEGLWPLCHIAHTRPTFRQSDWRYYQDVNERFAKVALEEMADTPEPSLLIQDYHFALVPRMIKERRPDARVSIFWHIPWPNPEAFSICPQQAELLDGLLGADLIGFHIQAHCINFLETVDHAIESRADLERFAVNRNGHVTLVHPFPISVPFPEQAAARGGGDRALSRDEDRAALLRELGVQARYIGVGVDRVDYTKGIPERFRGIEALLDAHPEYRGQLTFIQIGAPSRTNIKTYTDLQTESLQEAERINAKYRRERWQPIVFVNRSYNHEQIDRLFQAADFCLVTSLHDGMNLVAKEFVAARSDERGVLILSTFTGASRELTDALLVNPYDAPMMAEALRQAMEMPPAEQRRRMREMRRVVRENNVYKWAANLTSELASIRTDTVRPETVVA